MNEKAAKQPRQSDFDNSNFTQPPPKPAIGPVMPIDLLIPKQPVQTEPPQEPVKIEADQKSEQTPQRDKPSPAPRAKPRRDTQPPKEKISVMLPATMAERLKDIAYWERTTIAALAEQGLQVVLANKEKKNGGPYRRRKDELVRGRPAAGPSRSVKRGQA